MNERNSLPPPPRSGIRELRQKLTTTWIEKALRALSAHHAQPVRVTFATKDDRPGGVWLSTAPAQREPGEVVTYLGWGVTLEAAAACALEKLTDDELFAVIEHVYPEMRR